LLSSLIFTYILTDIVNSSSITAVGTQLLAVSDLAKRQDQGIMGISWQDGWIVTPIDVGFQPDFEVRK